MAEFLVKVANEQGRLVQQVEHGYSEAEVRDRYIQQGYLVYWVKPRGLLSSDGMPFRRGSRLKQSSFCLLYTSPSPRDMRRSRMPSSA